MKAEDILEAIGNADEESVKIARQGRKKKLWLYASSIAAVVIIAIIVPVYFYNRDKTIGEEGYIPEIELESGYVDIYYAENGEIVSEKQYLKLSSNEVFEAWRIKNNLGEDVKLYKVEIQSNGKTTFSEFSGEGVATHTPGDYFIYNITVSKALENNKVIMVYDPTLSTLKMTMLGYLNIEINEYNIFFQ